MKMLRIPSQAQTQSSRLSGFIDYVCERHNVNFGAVGADAYKKLQIWSVEHAALFHECVWDFCNIKGVRGTCTIEHPDSILDAVFFKDARISFAENMLARYETHPDEPAIISRVAGRDEDQVLSWRDLYNRVSQWVQILERYGVGDSDRVATYLPHIPEAYILMMACAQVGAVFSSVGVEMGAQAVSARFEQIQPKILIAVDGYVHMAKIGQSGEIQDRRDVVKALQCSVKSIEHTIIIPNLKHLGQAVKNDDLKGNVLDADSLLKDVHPSEIIYIPRDFNHPLAILFSSGSTGSPKCFVHGVGGTLIKHTIEHQLQCDVRAGDRVFFHSTTSWMMFNWLASGLAQGATLMIYDGNPAYPDAGAQLQFASDYGCTHLGTAAAIIGDVWAKNNVRGEAFDLSALRSIMYTGSVLSPEGFEYVHEHIKADMSIDGVCGGTDFVGCYTMGNPFTATIAGHLKGAVLGMAVEIWNDAGERVEDNEVGELVITKPFASRPLCFWNDADGSRFHGEYFRHFKCDPPVWRHGDAVKYSQDQIIVEGRSDTTLNQGGVRIGTQQIYDALEHSDLRGLIVDTLAASFKDAQGGDHTALFVVFKDGVQMDEGLKAQIKAIISDSVGRLCCPHEIIGVPYVLKTPNGKRAEKPTSQILNGKAINTPETYGYDNERLKAQYFEKIHKQLHMKPIYEFVDAA